MKSYSILHLDLYRKYLKEVKRFPNRDNDQKRSASWRRILRYERRLKRWRIAAGLSLMLLCSTPKMKAQPIKLGFEDQVNTETSSGKQFPAAAMDANGNYVGVWESPGHEVSRVGNCGQRLNRHGNKVETEVLINTKTDDQRQFPKEGRCCNRKKMSLVKLLLCQSNIVH